MIYSVTGRKAEGRARTWSRKFYHDPAPIPKGRTNAAPLRNADSNRAGGRSWEEVEYQANKGAVKLEWPQARLAVLLGA